MMASELSHESRRYVKDAKRLNWLAFMRKYGPIAALIATMMAVIYLRLFWF